MNQDGTWQEGYRPQPRWLCVRWGPSPSPIFRPFLLRPNGWMHQDSTWYGGIGLIPEDPAPLPKGGWAPNFSAHVYCGQTAAWITVPLGTEVGLIPSDFMLDVAPAPLPKNGAEPPSLPIFGPCPLWPNGWMDQDSIWHGGGPWSAPHCARWGPSSPPQKGAGPLPAFAAHFYCGQMARCIKMPLGMEVGLSPGDFVLHRGSMSKYKEF